MRNGTSHVTQTVPVMSGLNDSHPPPPGRGMMRRSVHAQRKPYSLHLQMGWDGFLCSTHRRNNVSYGAVGILLHVLIYATHSFPVLWQHSIHIPMTRHSDCKLSCRMASKKARPFVHCVSRHAWAPQQQACCMAAAPASRNE